MSLSTKSFIREIKEFAASTGESGLKHSGTGVVREGEEVIQNKMTNSEHDRSDRKEAEVFELLRDLTYDLLKRFGRPDYQPDRAHGDFSVHGDYSGYPQVVVFISNLEMMRPPVISELQQLVEEIPGWEIEVTVAVRGHYDDWPNMGLYIRPHEIIDGLQRQYFPKEFQNLEYVGARPGTAND